MLNTNRMPTYNSSVIIFNITIADVRQLEFDIDDLALLFTIYRYFINDYSCASAFESKNVLNNYTV